MPSWKFTIPIFIVLLFLTRYYDFFYIYDPVKPFGFGTEPTMRNFIIYNFSLKVIFYAFKFLVVALILSAGIFLEGNRNKSEQASLKDLILLAALSEFVFFFRELYKIIDFSFIRKSYTFEDYSYFNPISVYELLGLESTSPFAYFTQTINVFEVAYIICLVMGLRKLQYDTNNKAITVALSSYGGGLIIWILTVTYFMIQ